MALAATIPNITIVSCYDADTCRVDLPRSAFNDDWAYDLFGHNIPIRVEGIDTPEIRGQCQKEKGLAYEARDLVLAYSTMPKPSPSRLMMIPKKLEGNIFGLWEGL